MTWRNFAECAGMGVEHFFDDGTQEAKAACDRCVVSAECYDYAIRNEEFGFWAGLGPAE